MRSRVVCCGCHRAEECTSLTNVIAKTGLLELLVSAFCSPTLTCALAESELDLLQKPNPMPPPLQH